MTPHPVVQLPYFLGTGGIFLAWKCSIYCIMRFTVKAGTVFVVHKEAQLENSRWTAFITKESLIELVRRCRSNPRRCRWETGSPSLIPASASGI